MNSRIFPVCSFLLIVITLSIFPVHPVDAHVSSLNLIDAYATLPGETAQVGRFDGDRQIDLLFKIDVETDDAETAYLTWDVYDRYDRTVYSRNLEMPCSGGLNSIRIPDAIPTDLGSGVQNYKIYASVRVGDYKDDTQFEIRIDSPYAFPKLLIEDVRLIPRDDDSWIAEEVGNAAIPYTIEIDFRVENIISWAHAQIRWLGSTVDGFVMDRGIGSTDVDEGFNSFKVDSLLARPPYGSTQQADFSVEINVIGYFDSVTFPIETLPVSLMELRSSSGVENEYAFSVGEAYLIAGDGSRATYFGKDEPITARILTGGIIPENTVLLMHLSGGPETPDGSAGPGEEFIMNLDSGTESPVIEYELSSDIEREPGFYEFRWSVLVGNVFFAERNVYLTISGRQGFEIPATIDLPGDAKFTAPLSWTVTLESEPGLFATMLTPYGTICRILGNSLDEPLNVELLADMFESDFANSGIPSDATALTTKSEELEGVFKSIRRAYLGNGKIFVHDYWLYRVDDGEYQFLVTTSVADEEEVTDAYMASDAIRAGLDLGI